MTLAPNLAPSKLLSTANIRQIERKAEPVPSVHATAGQNRGRMSAGHFPGAAR
jgi:hypothetical protein